MFSAELFPKIAFPRTKSKCTWLPHREDNCETNMTNYSSFAYFEKNTMLYWNNSWCLKHMIL